MNTLFKPSGCTHSRMVQRLIERFEEDGDETYPSIELVEETAFVDIDLHRYKCTLCGMIGYYSSAAKDYYEKGILSNVHGLGG
jgi:hypothetical protein